MITASSLGPRISTSVFIRCLTLDNEEESTKGVILPEAIVFAAPICVALHPNVFREFAFGPIYG